MKMLEVVGLVDSRYTFFSYYNCSDVIDELP